MNKRSDTFETTLLAIELLRRIPRERLITARELHESLKNAGIERDLRTIQRQLEMLCEHFEIERDDRSKPFGYRWLEFAKGLNVPNLTLQESLLLRLAEQHLGNLLPSPLMKSLDAFFTQARRNLGPDRDAKLDKEWLHKIRVVETSQPLIPPKVDRAVFDTVSEALYGNRWLHLTYQNMAGKKSEIQVMPLGLAQQGQRLYLVCRYKDHDNERSLALHRIHAAAASTLTFTRPKGFTLEKYDDDGRFGFGDGKRLVVSFRTDEKQAAYFIESPLSTDQVATPSDGHYEIRATVVDTTVLRQWIRGHSNHLWDVTYTPTAQ